MLYCNDGDWVESLTALVEHHDGRLEIIDRSAQATLQTSPLPAAPLIAPLTPIAPITPEPAMAVREPVLLP